VRLTDGEETVLLLVVQWEWEILCAFLLTKQKLKANPSLKLTRYQHHQQWSGF